jgi:hypothetical protein
MPGLKKSEKNILLYIVFVGNFPTIYGIGFHNKQQLNCLLGDKKFIQEEFP